MTARGKRLLNSKLTLPLKLLNTKKKSQTSH